MGKGEGDGEEGGGRRAVVLGGAWREKGKDGVCVCVRVWVCVCVRARV